MQRLQTGKQNKIFLKIKWHVICFDLLENRFQLLPLSINPLYNSGKIKGKIEGEFGYSVMERIKKSQVFKQVRNPVSSVSRVGVSISVPFSLALP